MKFNFPNGKLESQFEVIAEKQGNIIARSKTVMDDVYFLWKGPDRVEFAEIKNNQEEPGGSAGVPHKQRRLPYTV